jgi:hypothetical protein
MNDTRQLLTRILASGSTASLISTTAVALSSRRQLGYAAAGTNATSQWLFGRAALLQNPPSLKHTATGYAIHHITSLFWAAFYERAIARRPPASTAVLAAAATAAAAYFVDFHLTPSRLTPGFEKRLSTPALLGIYTAYAAGLAIAALLRRRSRPS